MIICLMGMYAFRVVHLCRFDHQASSSSCVAASPLLLHNMSSSTSDLRLTVRPTPFGSRPPPLPTARSVTIARVSSPYGSDRLYQPLFLNALKMHFESQVRLIKLGDLIAVGLKLEEAKRIGDELMKIAESSDEEREVANEQEDLVQFILNQE